MIPLPHTGWQSGDLSDSMVLAMVALAILLGVLAYRAKSWTLGSLSFFAFGVANPVLFLTANAFILFPVLLIATFKGRGIRYFLLLIAALLITPTLLYWRIPRPAPLPPGPHRDATAIVRHVETVNQLWATDEGGERLPEPFLQLQLEFTPTGANVPVHVLDRVDAAGLAGLKPGDKLPLVYSAMDPTAARVASGNRTYVRRAVVDLMRLSYLFGAGFTVFLLIIGGIGTIFSRLVGRVTEPIHDPLQREVLQRRIAQFPPDDPRRKALEALLRNHPGES